VVILWKSSPRCDDRHHTAGLLEDEAARRLTAKLVKTCCGLVADWSATPPYRVPRPAPQSAAHVFAAGAAVPPFPRRQCPWARPFLPGQERHRRRRPPPGPSSALVPALARLALVAAIAALAAFVTLAAVALLV